MTDPQARFDALTTHLTTALAEARGLADAVSVYLSRDDAEPCDCDLMFLCHDCQLRRSLAAFEAAEDALQAVGVAR